MEEKWQLLLLPAHHHIGAPVEIKLPPAHQYGGAPAVGGAIIFPPPRTWPTITPGAPIWLCAGGKKASPALLYSGAPVVNSIGVPKMECAGGNPCSYRPFPRRSGTYSAAPFLTPLASATEISRPQLGLGRNL